MDVAATRWTSTKPPVEKLAVLACAAFAALSLIAFCSLTLRFGELRGWGVPEAKGQEGRGGGGGGGGGRDDACDLFDGKWVQDESYPLYESKDCPFVDEGFRCTENGRPDRLYTKWRWQPSRCNLPRFDAKLMLEKLRNRRVVFSGDSIGRNQWESLLCMLSSAVADKDSVYEVNGDPVTKHKGFLVFRFRDYNCTVEYYRVPHLVLRSRPPPGAPEFVNATLRLDVMDWRSAKWRDADVLVLNSGHWWNHEKLIRSGCYFQEGKKVNMQMSVESAYQRSIKTLFDWINKEVNTSKTQVIFRTYSPAHFSKGDWNSGGTCHLETVPDVSSSQYLSSQKSYWSQFLIPFTKPLTKNSNQSSLKGLEVLNVTQMTAQRSDGHQSLYHLPPMNRTELYREDCSHWCLPGVPDAWNELLYALFLIRELRPHTN